MKPDLKEAFGRVIKQLRLAQGLSQEQLAELSEVDRSYISDLERGLNHPSLNTVYRLAEIFKIRPSELIRKVDDIMKL